jgi:large subunit ribosomal protein LX
MVRDMTTVKTFQIQGEIRKSRAVMPFRKLVKALDEKEAVEKVYMLFGSRHKAKRFQIKILKVEEKPESAPTSQ